MANIRTIIIDDERLARKELVSILQPYSEIEIIGECSNVDEAVEMIEANQPDLIFLDIQMPEKNGFDLLEELDFTPEVVFVTAYDEYAIKAFQVNALDYLLKPIEKERLQEVINKVKAKVFAKASAKSSDNSNILSLENQVFVKDGEKCWFVKLKEVRLFESEGNYVKVYFENNKPMILNSLNNLEEKLDSKFFIRANRKHIINIEWVSKIENWFGGRLRAIMKDGAVIEISRRQATKIKHIMSL